MSVFMFENGLDRKVAIFVIVPLKITKLNILKSSGWGLEKSELPWEWNFFIAIGVFPVELSACQVSMFYTANWPR